MEYVHRTEYTCSSHLSTWKSVKDFEQSRQRDGGFFFCEEKPGRRFPVNGWQAAKNSQEVFCWRNRYSFIMCTFLEFDFIDLFVTTSYSLCSSLTVEAQEGHSNLLHILTAREGGEQQELPEGNRSIRFHNIILKPDTVKNMMSKSQGSNQSLSNHRVWL